MRLIEDLKNQAAGLMAASDAVELEALRLRMQMAAETMLRAVRYLERPEPTHVPRFLLKRELVE